MCSLVFPLGDFCELAASVHFRAPLKSSLLLFFVQLEFLLLGTVLAACLRTKHFARFNLPDLGFIGLCIAAAFAQIWSLFGGLRPLSNIVLLLGAAGRALFRYRSLVEIVRGGVRETRWRNLILVLPLWLVGAFNALTNGFCYDGGLYHLAAVRWIWEYGAVPGLANLHGRLGFNSALSAVAALVGVPFGLRLGQEFVNPSLVILAGGVVSQGLFGKRSRLDDFPRTIYSLSLFAFLGGLIFSPCLPSPQPDVGGAALAILAAWYFREILFRSELTVQENTNLLFLCLSAAVLALQIKLSYLAPGIATTAIALPVVWLRFRRVSPVVFVGLWQERSCFHGFAVDMSRAGFPFFLLNLAD